MRSDLSHKGRGGTEQAELEGDSKILINLYPGNSNANGSSIVSRRCER
jgi:hypothetical protein